MAARHTAPKVKAVYRSRSEESPFADYRTLFFLHRHQAGLRLLTEQKSTLQEKILDIIEDKKARPTVSAKFLPLKRAWPQSRTIWFG